MNSIDAHNIKPISWGPSLVILLCISMMYYFTHYHFVPYFANKTQQPYLIGFLIGWITTVSIISVVSIVAFRSEGNKVISKEITQRFRMKKMNLKDWMWTLILIAVSLVSYVGLSPVAEWLATINIFLRQ